MAAHYMRNSANMMVPAKQLAHFHAHQMPLVWRCPGNGVPPRALLDPYLAVEGNPKAIGSVADAWPGRQEAEGSPGYGAISGGGANVHTQMDPTDQEGIGVRCMHHVIVKPLKVSQQHMAKPAQSCYEQGPCKPTVHRCLVSQSSTRRPNDSGCLELPWTDNCGVCSVTKADAMAAGRHSLGSG